MLTRWITLDDITYCVHYTVNSGRDASPWGDDPGWPTEVNIQAIKPDPHRAHVWRCCQAILERDEVLADYREECKADYQRTGGDDD